MLKIRVWDKEKMHDQNYAGPIEYTSKQCFVDSNGFFVFQDQNHEKQSFNPDFYKIDIFGGC